MITNASNIKTGKKKLCEYRDIITVSCGSLWYHISWLYAILSWEKSDKQLPYSLKVLILK